MPDKSTKLLHPGKYIRQKILATYNLTVSTAAEVLGVRRATLSDLLNENASLSPEMALRLEKAFGLNMNLMLEMQASHDAAVMRERAQEINVLPFQKGAG